MHIGHNVPAFIQQTLLAVEQEYVPQAPEEEDTEEEEDEEEEEEEED